MLRDPITTRLLTARLGLQESLETIDELIAGADHERLVETQFQVLDALESLCEASRLMPSEGRRRPRLVTGEPAG
jgi:hypothetical protein